MMSDSNKQQKIKEALRNKLTNYFGVAADDASKEQVYKAVILTVKDMLTKGRSEYRKSVKEEKAKRIYYLCMEFLIGPSLRNNLRNLGIADEYAEVLAEMGYDISDIYAMERDPGLGNGGLGRLAACFMDSLTTLDLPATGYSLCYEYGFFEQMLIRGEQVELPDVWKPSGEGWLVPRPDKTFTVRFGGKLSEKWEDDHLNIVHTDYEEVQAVPYDMMISGYNSFAVNNLRLWKAHNMTNFNMKLFTQGQYELARQKNISAETITQVLYPSDEHEEGKELRLKQQYFLVSASLQNILADHLAVYGTLSNFAEKNSIHIPLSAFPSL